MTNAKEKFHSDLESGRKGERHVAAFIKKQTGAKKVSTAFAGKSHDFTLLYEDGTKVSYEIKTDFYEEKSGNVYLEYECSNKPSGLTATGADFWAIFLPHKREIIVFKPQDLFTYLKENKIRTVKGGDGYRTRGFLIKSSELSSLDFCKTYASSRNSLRPKVVDS